MPTREHAHLVAQCLARAVNPELINEDMPVAAALLQPVALRTVELLAAGGYTLAVTAPEPVETPERPHLTLLQGRADCHNGACGCQPDPA